MKKLLLLLLVLVLSFSITFSQQFEAINSKIIQFENAEAVICNKTNKSGATLVANKTLAPFFKEDFETGTKAAYAAGTVTCTTGEWYMDSTLIGGLANDKKNGLKSVRMINTRYLTQNFNTNGIGSVTIWHANYGTDIGSKWKLQISIDNGVSWNDVGSEVTAESVLASQSFTVNQSGDARIRIVKTAGGGNRLNIDDITLTPYIAPAETEYISSSSTNWSLATNWSNGSPGATTNVTIPANKAAIIAKNEQCKSITMAPGSSLTINEACGLTVENDLTLKADATGTASLINYGTLTGNTIAENYSTANKWHLYATPASGQTVANFLSSNSLIPTKLTNRGMMDFNTSLNVWNSYFTDGATNGDLTVSRGFSLRTNADGAIISSGTVTSGEVNVSTSVAGSAWNLIGNPYTSAVALNESAIATNNFLTINSTKFDPTAAAIYLWDESISTTSYTIINNTSAATYIQSGQGLFLKTNADQTFSFTPAMQSHQTAVALKSTNFDWSEIKLFASVNGKSSSTLVKFNDKMSTGLDVTYDACALKMANTVSIYTRLMNDQGVDFALQCLPNRNFDNMVIPVSIECKSGGKITFSALTLNLSSGCKAVLEDRVAGTFTDLTNGATYDAIVAAETNGAGRFYLKTSDAVALSTFKSKQNKIRVYSDGTDICISGNINSGSKASITDITGRNISTFNLNNSNFNRLTTNLKKGIYLISITSDGKSTTERIAIK